MGVCRQCEGSCNDGLCSDCVGELQQQLAAARAEVERLRLKSDAYDLFIRTEMQWCDFRGEMLSDNVSHVNAKKLADFLDGLDSEAAEQSKEPTSSP